MPRVIRFIELELINFTSHRNLTVNYGDITKLSGMNGQGKTSIGTAPVWVLYGNDLQGKTFNPSPLNYEFDRVFASILLEIDGVPIKFAREIEGGKNAFFINDVPTKAKEYDAAVASLFDKDEFLSLYNPQYFFTQHWTKQREQIMKYTTAPAKSDVLAEMSRTNPEQKTKDIPLNPAALKLDELTKKHSLDDLQKIHGGTGGQKSKLEKQHIAAQSKTKTLAEQLNRLPEPSEQFNIEEAQAQANNLMEQIRAIEKVTDSAGDNNAKINALNGRIRAINDQRDRMKHQFPTLQNETITNTCRVCKQSLQGDAIASAEQEKQKRIDTFKDEFNGLIAQRKTVEEELGALEFIDVNEQLVQVRELEQQRQMFIDAIRDAEEWNRLGAEVEKAKNDESATLASLKESIFILDAIKSYLAKEAELQAAKVQSLFTTLSIRLFKYVKSTDEYEPDFSVQMNGKDYAVLSVGEKITAGLELTEVLFKQSELITPTFIDGIGEYTGKVAVYGQLITGRAIPDQALKIETE